MKKFATVLLAIVLSLSALTFAACQPEGGNNGSNSNISDKDVIGVWKITGFSVTADGESFYTADASNVQLSDLPEKLRPYGSLGILSVGDLGMKTELKEDKSVLLSYDNAPDGFVNPYQGKMSWKIENGNVVITVTMGNNSQTMVLKPNKDGLTWDYTEMANMVIRSEASLVHEDLDEVDELLMVFTKQ